MKAHTILFNHSKLVERDWLNVLVKLVFVSLSLISLASNAVEHQQTNVK